MEHNINKVKDFWYEGNHLLIEYEDGSIWEYSNVPLSDYLKLDDDIWNSQLIDIPVNLSIKNHE